MPAKSSTSPTLLQRIRAAKQTAQSSASCLAVSPFYWELGDKGGMMTGGSVGGGYSQGDAMPIASASKWVWGAYMAQRGFYDADLPYLNFTSGYCNMHEENFPNDATVDDILAIGDNDVQSPDAIGKFFYNSGHMQQQAHALGFGSYARLAFTNEVQSVIGRFGFVYTAPVPAGSIRASAAEYAQFLRAIMNGALRIGSMLGSSQVATQGPDALSSPTTRAWHYSIGHWVENAVGDDGSFSSAGAFGFYPWIDAGKTLYGIVARVGLPGSGEASVEAGQTIRKAWVTGQVQP